MHLRPADLDRHRVRLLPARDLARTAGHFWLTAVVIVVVTWWAFGASRPAGVLLALALCVLSAAAAHLLPWERLPRPVLALHVPAAHLALFCHDASTGGPGPLSGCTLVLVAVWAGLALSRRAVLLLGLPAVACLLSGVLAGDGVDLVTATAGGVVTVLAGHAVASLTARWGEQVTLLEESRAELEAQVWVDPVTGLATRAALTRVLHAVVARPAPVADACGVLLLAGLVGFPRLNDGRGAAAGDALLHHVGRLLEDLPGQHAVARLGSATFAVLIERDARPAAEQARQLAAAVVTALDALHELDGRPLHLPACVGTHLLRAGERPEDALHDASRALREATAAGGGSVRASRSDELGSADSADLVAELRHAVGTGQLRVHLQPLVDLRAHRVAGFEALVRWQHPTRGLLLPGAFVDLAEETGVVTALGDHVLREAVATLAAWRDDPVLRGRTISVNVSPRQLEDPDLPARVVALLGTAGVPVRTLVLEVTETARLPRGAVQVLRACAAAGLRLHLDDFGTGFSSLDRVRDLPLAAVKVHRDFVSDLGRGRAPLVEGVVALAAAAGLRVVGEGVETADQARTLAATGCDVGQGFVWSPAVPVPEVRDLVTRLDAAGPLCLPPEHDGVGVPRQRVLRPAGRRPGVVPEAGGVLRS